MWVFVCSLYKLTSLELRHNISSKDQAYSNYIGLHKVFVDDESWNSGHGHAYDSYGIDPEQGCLVVVRPDHCKWPP